MILLIDPAPDPALKLAAGWREVRRGGVPGAHLIVAERR